MASTRLTAIPLLLALLVGCRAERLEPAAFPTGESSSAVRDLPGFGEPCTSNCASFDDVSLSCTEISNSEGTQSQGFCLQSCDAGFDTCTVSSDIEEEDGGIVDKPFANTCFYGGCTRMCGGEAKGSGCPPGWSCDRSLNPNGLCLNPDGGIDAGCPGHITFSVDGIVTTDFKSVCKYGWDSTETKHGEGYIEQGGAPSNPEHTNVEGCDHPSVNAEKLWLTLTDARTRGSYDKGTITYVDSSGTTWTGTAPHAQITKFEAPGGQIAGSFHAQLQGGDDAGRTLVGTFSVCRVGDQDVP